MTHAVQIDGVRKTFGRKVAVDHLDLAVPMGSLCGFIGPNGAGKTTTIRMIMSIIFPDRGELSVLGKASAVESKDRIGYLPEERGIYRKMKVGAFLTYMGKLKGVEPDMLRPRVRQWLERVELSDVINKRCEELSKGMQQKVQFVATIIHDPDLIILDEPFSGLDPVNMLLLRDLLLELHEQGKTVLFSTHVMQQAERLCDRIVMIHGGKKVLDSTLDGIREQFASRTVIVEPLVPASDPGAFRSVPGVVGVETGEQGTFDLTVDESVDPASVLRQVAAGDPVRRVEIKRPSLEDVFVSIAGADALIASDDTEEALRG